MTEVISKARIEREAREAARAGKSLDEACPYPWASDAAMHFKAAYLCSPLMDAWERAGFPLDVLREEDAA